jgi:hypothetical protein
MAGDSGALPGGGFADAGSGFCVAVGKRPPTESLHSLASGPCPPVRGGPLAPCPAVARSCRTEREPPIPPKLQTRTLFSVNVM